MPILCVDCKTMTPTSHTIKTGYDRPDNPSMDVADQKQFRLYSEFWADHEYKVVPWRIVREHNFPKNNDLRLIFGTIGPDLYFRIHRKLRHMR